MNKILKEENYFVISNLDNTEFFMNYTPEAGGYALYTKNISNAKKFKTVEDIDDEVKSITGLRTLFVIGVCCMYTMT